MCEIEIDSSRQQFVPMSDIAERNFLNQIFKVVKAQKVKMFDLLIFDF